MITYEGSLLLRAEKQSDLILLQIKAVLEATNRRFLY